MSLPAPPGQRMAYDRDGTIPFGGLDYSPDGPGGTCVTLTNAENNTGGEFDGYQLSVHVGSARTCYYGLLFPEPRDIYGVFWQMNPQDTGTPPYSIFETSVDTADGTDGTWVSQTGPDTDATEAYNPQPSTGGTGVVPYYRTEIVNDLFASVPVTGVVGVRVSSSTSFAQFIQTLHVYGQPSSGDNPDSLRFWQNGTDAEVGGGYFDFGDTTGGGTYAIEFKLRNISSTYTANGISLSCETLSDASPSLISQFLVSLDGVTYNETVAVGDIAPSTTTGTLYIQLTVAGGAQNGACEVRMVALPTSWT